MHKISRMGAIDAAASALDLKALVPMEDARGRAVLPTGHD